MACSVGVGVVWESTILLFPAFSLTGKNYNCNVISKLYLFIYFLKNQPKTLAIAVALCQMFSMLGQVNTISLAIHFEMGGFECQ